MSRSNRVVVIGGGSGMGLAVELAPLRVNAVSPGWTDTTIWDGMTGMSQDKKKELFAAMAALSQMPQPHFDTSSRLI